MEFLKKTARLIRKGLGRLLMSMAGTAGALSLHQLLVFIHQYAQSMGDHIRHIRLTAIDRGMPDLIGQARDLEETLRPLQESSGFDRLFRFAGAIDREIIRKAGDEFTPSLVLDGEGVLYLLAGTLLGILAWLLLSFLVTALTRRVMRRFNRSVDAGNAPRAKKSPPAETGS